MIVRCVRNASLLGREGRWNLTLSRGSIEAITPAAVTPAAITPAAVTPAAITPSDLAPRGAIDASEGEIDARGQLVTPPFVEPHVHLDTCLTAGQPAWNQSGTLFEGIQRWSERKRSLTSADVKQRARQAIDWQIANGVQFVRTHCDVTDPELVALKALLELKEELASQIGLQIVAFPQEGIRSYPKGAELLEEALRLGADVVGAIPHFEFTREDGVASLQIAFDLAERYDRLVDVHCDEIDDEQSRFVEVVAAEAYHRRMGPRVTASHTTAMGSYNDAYSCKLFRLLGLAGISFVSNPLVNIHLQGRFDTYPKRRGLTRVKELLAAGLNVCFGHDDIFDPWYPLGTANMLQVLHMGLHVCQLMGYEDIRSSLRLITTHSAHALALGDQYGLEVGRPAHLLVLGADSEYDAVRRQAPVLWSIRHGRVLAETRPSQTYVSTTGERRLVNFQQRGEL